MVNLDRIKKLAKDKGWSLSFVCSKMGVSAGYFTDVKNNKISVTQERLLQIANILDTTPEYLTNKTDIKNPTTNSDGVDYIMDIQTSEMITLYQRLSPELQKLAREQLRLLVNSLTDKDKQ